MSNGDKQEGKYMCSECDTLYNSLMKGCPRCNRLKELRSMCKHENRVKGNYSYRVGCISPAILCSDCGSFIEYI